MRPFRLICSIATATLLATASASAQAPSRLRNKSITLSYATANMLKAFDGRTVSRSVHREVHIYVSSQGRLFVKSARQGRGHSDTQHSGPGDSASGTHATGLRFQGNQLLAHIPFEGAAAMAQATFDSGFSSCTLNVVFGKETGGKTARIRGVDGNTYEVISMSAVHPTCSVKAGNIFGS
jgi:hypothetical protein